MVRDKKEQNRKLSEAEQRRYDRYEQVSADYAARGYERKELTVGIVSANLFALVIAVPVCIAGVVLFYLANPGKPFMKGSVSELLLFLVLMFVLIVVHEGIHGAAWSLFAEHRWKDIEFGFMKQYLTPYCTCSCPLSRGKYIFGALMPLVLLGLLPMAAGILAGSGLWLMLGIVMTISAGGDILLVIRILLYRSRCREIVYLDHPTQAGGVVFEK